MKFLKKYAPLAGLLIAVTVRAQTAPAPAPATTSLSTADIRLRIDSLKKDIDENQRRVLHLQALTRKEKDVIKLTCVNDKLMQMKAQTNLFDNASLQLDASINSNDEAQKAASLADAEKAGAAVKQLRSEADACAGELEMYKQESGAEVQRPDLDDPTSTGWGFDVHDVDPTEVEPPGFATPFK